VNGWHLFDPVAEYKRLGLLDHGCQLCTVNTDFSLCSSYPATLCVPSAVAEGDIRAASSFRKHGRFPVICWRHPHTGSILARSSQPLVGVVGSRSAEDERLAAGLAAVAGGGISIFDARRQRAVMLQKFVSGGTEGNRYEATTSFCKLRNMHVVRDSYFTFVELCQPLAKKTLRNLRRLEGVKHAQWFNEMGQLIQSAVSIAQCLQGQAGAVLVHCSDGWNRTTQLVSLAQILLDPQARTLVGFAQLVEKEWVGFGYRFADRGDLGVKGHPTNAFSPIFLMWLDCVWQIQQLQPSAFEFNDRLLLCVADSSFHGRHGTFLFNSQQESLAARAPERTVSLWTEVVAQSSIFENRNYKPEDGLLLKTFDPATQLQLWEAYHLRYLGDEWNYRERTAEQAHFVDTAVPSPSPAVDGAQTF